MVVMELPEFGEYDKPFFTRNPQTARRKIILVKKADQENGNNSAKSGSEDFPGPSEEITDCLGERLIVYWLPSPEQMQPDSPPNEPRVPNKDLIDEEISKDLINEEISKDLNEEMSKDLISEETSSLNVSNEHQMEFNVDCDNLLEPSELKETPEDCSKKDTESQEAEANVEEHSEKEKPDEIPMETNPDEDFNLMKMDVENEVPEFPNITQVAQESDDKLEEIMSDSNAISIAPASDKIELNDENQDNPINEDREEYKSVPLSDEEKEEYKISNDSTEQRTAIDDVS